MKNLTLILLFSFVSLLAFAQNDNPKYTVPSEYTFVEPEDYDTYEPQIREVIDWYLWRSLAFDSEKRRDASAFFFQWLIGTPTVSVELNTNIANFLDNNPELLMPFMMGWTKYSLENDTKDKIECNIASIETVVGYYNKNKGFLKKDKNIEDYEKMMKKNKLKNYIKKNINNLD